MKHFSLSPGEVGLVITSYTLPGVVFALLVGLLADKFGRKAILIPSLTIFSIAGGSIYWVDDFFWVNVLRFLQGVGGAALPAIGIVLIGDLFDEKIRLKVMGMNAAVLSVGTALFPFFGGMLAMKGWNVPFLAFWLGLLLAVFTVLFFKEPKIDRQRDGSYLKGAIKQMLNARALSVFSIGLVIFILLYGGILTYLTLYMDSYFSMSAFSIGIFIASASVASGSVAIASHRIEKLLGRRLMLAVGFLFYTVSFGSVIYLPSYEWLLFTMLSLGIAIGLTIPLLQSMATMLAPAEYRGIVVMVFGMLIRLGQTVGPPLLATLLLFGELELVFEACMLIALFTGLLIFIKGSVFENAVIG